MNSVSPVKWKFETASRFYHDKITCPDNDKTKPMKTLSMKVKKYKYLAKSALLRRFDYARGVLRRFTFDYDRKLDELDIHSLPYPTDWHRIRQYERLVVEIGSGHGELIANLSQKRPDDLFIGFEIISKFMRMGMRRLSSVDNARIFKAEAYGIIPLIFADETIDETYILFPDPWHKKRHHKRRPLTTEWFNILHRKTVAGGSFLFATDWEDYYDFVSEQLETCDAGWDIKTGEYNPESFGLPQTHYYKKWLKLGRNFRYILGRKR